MKDDRTTVKEQSEALPPLPETVEVVGVTFRGAGKCYWFAPGRQVLACGDKVIVETARGAEIGTVNMAARTVRGSEIVPPLRSVIRVATPDDLARAERNRKLEQEAAVIFREKVAHHKLDMNLVSVEYTFDNAKLLFYYTAENRVDFRELVKDLASVFKTRIELRQIGIRDEAKMIGGIGVCGRPFCCSTFLGDFAQVSIKMAKEQNFSLNSAKISGTCGRLMCCLRYEHECYEEAQKTTPSTGTPVSTPDGNGVVIETRPLAQQVRVRLEGEAKEAPKFYPCSEVVSLRRGGKDKDGKGKEAPDARTEEAKVTESASDAGSAAVLTDVSVMAPDAADEAPVATERTGGGAGRGSNRRGRRDRRPRPRENGEGGANGGRPAGGETPKED